MGLLDSCVSQNECQLHRFLSIDIPSSLWIHDFLYLTDSRNFMLDLMTFHAPWMWRLLILCFLSDKGLQVKVRWKG